MKPLLISLFLLVGVLGVGSVFAEDTPTTALLVLSKHDQTLAIVDPSSLKVIARVPVGKDPHEVIASTDGKVAYVSNYGSGAFHTLAVVDLIAQKALPSIDLGALRGPHGLILWMEKCGSPRKAPRPSAAMIPRRKMLTGFSAPGKTGRT